MLMELRQTVLAKMAVQGKVSPNSREMKAYKRALPPLSPFLVLVAIGLMLGDVSLQSNAAGTAHRIKFEWGDINKAYAFYVYSLFNMYCLSEPREQVRINANGNSVTTWCFQTVMHPSFNVLADLFIRNGKKVILFAPLLEAFGAVSLAFWFMDDGGLLSYKPGRYGLQLHTQGFSQLEVDSLARLLREKYGLKSWLKLKVSAVSRDWGRWTIAISGDSYELFLGLVKPHIHESMVRKLPIGTRTTL